jgi:hypothetical protein
MGAIWLRRRPLIAFVIARGPIKNAIRPINNPTATPTHPVNTRPVVARARTHVREHGSGVSRRSS